MNYSIKKLYDSLTGRDVKEIKSNDIFHLATNGSVTGAAGTILATTTTTANKDLFLTHFVVGGKANSSVYVVVGSSTILPTNIAANANSVQISGKLDNPLYKTGGASAVTVSIYATDAGTYTASLAGVYHPTFAKIETA